MTTDIRSCGCPIEYHLADCPIIAPAYDDPYDDESWRDNFIPDPQEFELEKWFDTIEEARSFAESLHLDYNLGWREYRKQYVVEYDA